MKNLLDALQVEAASLFELDGGYDYRQRTRVERALFALTSEFCRLTLDLKLGGLTYVISEVA
jgi:hypothetical protein